MEEQDREKRKRDDEGPDVEAHRKAVRRRGEDERDDAKSDETPDVEAHAKAVRR
jgi:hypothetical protein